MTSRGNNKETIFWDDVDRRLFLALLGAVVRGYGWIVWAYCLMTNHYHMIVQTPFGGLSDGMRFLNGEFSRRTNRRHGRCRHLFQNRFGAALIESETHLLEACRYVVLNANRAGLCRSPEGWGWSSYRATAGLEPAPPFLAAGRLLGAFDARPEVAREAYRAYVTALRE